MRPRFLIASAAVCASLLAACAAPAAPTATTQPTTAPVKPTAAAVATTAPAAATAPSAPATAAPAIATSAPAATSGAPATAASAAAKPAGAAGDVRTWKIMPEQSQVTVKVNERLADRPTNSDAVLNTTAVTGQIMLSPDGKVLEGSKLIVSLDQLKSDSGTRDRFIKGNVLRTSNFPNAEFTPTEMRGLPSPLPTSGEFKAQMVGTMKIRDASKPVTFDVTGRIEGGVVKGTATSELKITDFGMTLPRVPMVLSMEDLARLEVAFSATT